MSNPVTSPSSVHSPPILIIGGGIVGLSASLFLSQHAVPSILIERHSSTSIHPRARSVNARTMELYRSLGLCDQVREAGAAISGSFGIYSGHDLNAVIGSKARAAKAGEENGGTACEAKEREKKKKKKTTPLAGLMAGISPENGPFVTQDMLEPVLLSRAKENGVDVRFNTECTNVSQDNDGVTASLKDRSTGSLSTVRAKYLIAADGAGSPIRKALDIPTTGRGSMGHLLNILFEADLTPLVKGREFSLCVADRPEVSGLFTSINNTDRWVFHMCYTPSPSSSRSSPSKEGHGQQQEIAQEAFPSSERCKELLHLALGLSPTELDLSIISILPWEPTVRIASQMRKGRIFLAGDAAHQMPPWGGQGANSGIADVHNLAWKLATVLSREGRHHPEEGNNNDALLDTYETERKAVGQMAAEASARAADHRGLIDTKLSLKVISGWAKRLRYMSGHGYFYSSKAVCEEDLGWGGGWSWTPWTLQGLGLGCDGRPGSRVPHLWVEKAGERISTLDVVCGHKFVLFVGNEGQAWSRAAEGISSKLGVDIAGYRVGLQGNLVATNGVFETAAGVSSKGAILVRPDGFVAWRERRLPANPEHKLGQALRQALQT